MKTALLLAAALLMTLFLGLFAWLLADTTSEILMFTAIFCVCLAVPVVTISHGNVWRHNDRVPLTDVRRFAYTMTGIAVLLLFAMIFV